MNADAAQAIGFTVKYVEETLKGAGALKGDKGDKGDTGTTYTPVIGAVTMVDNMAGASANVVTDEATQKATFNFNIPQGRQGIQGEQGEQGIQGEKGDDGYPFLIYKQYEVGIEEFNEADYPEIGLMFMIHVWEDDKGYPVYRYTGDGTATPYTLITYMNTEGVKGEKGDKGDQGEQGVAGANGVDGITYTPEIGTVNTVESSASASVTLEVRPDESRAIYNFDLPRGLDGTNGNDGQDGVDGVSPTVEETEDGHTVKVEDANGLQQFEVLNGKDGVQIDDETTSTDTVWSSKKTSDEIAEVESKVDGLLDNSSTSETSTWSSSKVAQQDGIKQVFYASSASYPTIFWILSDDTSGVFWFKHTFSRDDTVKTVEGYADLTNDKVIITTNVGEVNTKISTDSISGKKGVVIRIIMMTGDVKITEARPLTATPTLITNR